MAILKNNVPWYIPVDSKSAGAEEIAADEDVAAISRRLMAQNRAAYEELRIFTCEGEKYENGEKSDRHSVHTLPSSGSPAHGGKGGD